VPPVD
jgi:hypothetical protein